jgi:adenine-specific DNA-methyltransferase
MNKQRLELTWIGKEQQPKVEPRILLEDCAKSYHASRHTTEQDLFDNHLIFGDNLIALKALEREFTGKIKCIYIDPPYNTGSAFEHFDDGVEHSIWLSLMRDRLEILWKLLRPIDGSIWVSIDDREMPYLRALMDELCGRHCFVACNVWQKRYSRENRESIGDVHEYIVVYAKSVDGFKSSRNRVPLEERSRQVYRNPNNDPRGPWRVIPMNAQGHRVNQMYPITAPGGRVHYPPEGRCWSIIEERFLELLNAGRIYFGADNNSQPNVIRYLSEVPGHVPWTWWPHDEVGHTDEAKKESIVLYGADAFPTPKPERLIRRVIEIATNPGDLVLDSFAGSGTTGAVAQKMGRPWIMVELGEHCHTHIIPRLRKVVDGTDPGGITEVVGWQSGGGFRYYRLAPSLLEKDRWGNWVINRLYNPAMLAEAVCKLMGFTYAPSEDHYWMHGFSTERDFIYVTTQSLAAAQLRAISEDVGENRSLLICCKAFRADVTAFPKPVGQENPAGGVAQVRVGQG